MNLSPKVYVPVLITIAAAALLYLLTGDKTYLVTVLLSLTAGGAGIAARPTATPGVTQSQVEAFAASKNHRASIEPPGSPTGKP